MEVPGLDQVDGILKRDTDDAAEFTVGAVELDFGPEAWVLTAAATEDFDDDGRTEKLLAELNGLVGQSVRSAGRIDADGDEADVYLLNDLTYRDPVSDQVPWRPTPAPGEPASRRTVTDAAVAAVGPQSSGRRTGAGAGRRRGMVRIGARRRGTRTPRASRSDRPGAPGPRGPLTASARTPAARLVVVTDLDAFIAGLPKAELHVHHVGSASPRIVAALAERHPGTVPSDLDELKRFFVFDDFAHFIRNYLAVVALIKTAEDVRLLTYEIAAEMAGQQIRYAELTVTPYISVTDALPVEAFLEAIEDARRAARS